MKAQPGAEAHEIHYEETTWKARPDWSPDENAWCMPPISARPGISCG